MFFFDFPTDIISFLTPLWKIVNILLLILLGVIYYLAFKKPNWANFLVIILLPTYLFRGKILFLPFTYLEVCILVVSFALVVRMFVNKEKIIKNFRYPYRWPITLILLAATVSIFISPNFHAATGLWKAYFIEAIMFFIVLINTVRTKKDRDLILWALGLSTIVISLLAVYQKYYIFGIAEPSWVSEQVRRVNSVYTSPNAVGLFLGPVIAIYLGWILNDIKKKANFSFYFIGKIFILIAASLAVIYTVSQGTWLGLVVAIVFISFFGWSKKWTSLIIIFLIILTLIVPQTRSQILPLMTFQDASGQNRLVLWSNSASYLTSSAKNFIFGAGIFGFSQIQENFRDPLKMESLIYPHNIILNFWLELGLMGLIGFAWMFFEFFKKGFNKLKTAEDKYIMLGIMAAIITIIVHGLIDVPYFKNDLSVLFWIIASLTVI